VKAASIDVFASTAQARSIPEGHDMTRIITAAFLCCIFVFSSATARAADLPRRPVLGAGIAAVPDATRTAQNVPPGQGVLITSVLPGLGAEAGGVKSNDILLVLDGRKISGVADIQAAVRAHRIGDKIGAAFLRDGKRMTAQIPLKGLPYETADDFDITYEAVDVGQSTRRVIITKPHDGMRHPALLMIGGIGCYSYDAGTNTDDPYRQLLYPLTRRGFVTMRVEKSGVGDSTGAPCADVDMQTELDGYVAGLHMLKAKDYVDPARAFIIGHSIGGVVGPLAAAKEPVRGILAMETVGLTWFEYELINSRRQLKLSGAPPAEMGAQMMRKEWCMHRLLIEREPRAQILKAKPECAEEMKYPASDAYMQQVAGQNLAALWTALKGVDVAIVYGAADFVTGAEESKAVVDAVNAVHAGAASYIEIPDMDHYLVLAPSQAASRQRLNDGGNGEFHPRLAQIIGDWLAAKAG
jgi:pimeloyl-ACP methyl ester carboxylesterase